MYVLAHPGYKKKIFPWIQQKTASHMLRAEQEVEEEDFEEEEQEEEEEEGEEEEGDDHLFNSQHECPLIRQKVHQTSLLLQRPLLSYTKAVILTWDLACNHQTQTLLK